jgi:hypothetical protein
MQWLKPVQNYLNAQGWDIGIDVLFVCLISAGFVVFALIFVMVVLISRIRRDYLAGWQIQFDNQLEPLLLDLIYANQNSFEAWRKQPAFQVFEKKFLLKKRGRMAMIAVLSRLRTQLEGRDAKKLELAYHHLQLWKDSIQLLHSTYWHKQAIGIRQLGELNYVAAIPEIKRLVDHPREEVRMEAQLALIQLDQRDPLGFLDTLQKSISLRSRVGLYEALNKKTGIEIAQFAPWMYSKNPDVQLFAAEMAGHFNKAADADALLQLVKHPNTEIAIAAIHSLEKLGDQHSLQQAIQLADKNNLQVWEALLQSLAASGYQGENDWLNWLASEHFELAEIAFNFFLKTNSVNTIIDLAKDLPEKAAIHSLLKQYHRFESANKA